MYYDSHSVPCTNTVFLPICFLESFMKSFANYQQICKLSSYLKTSDNKNLGKMSKKFCDFLKYGQHGFSLKIEVLQLGIFIARLELENTGSGSSLD